MATEEQIAAVPFLHRMLHAQVAELEWSLLSPLVAESWITLGGASAAVLISPGGAEELQLDCCRAVVG